MDQLFQSNNYQPFTKLENGKYEIATNSLYQSSFLPLFQNAETQIKKTIIMYFYNHKLENELRFKLSWYISQVAKQIPETLVDKQVYINGLKAKTNKMIAIWFTQANIRFNGLVNIINQNNALVGKKVAINTPRELIAKINENKIQTNLWADAKASVRVKNYPQEIKTFINRISNETITTYEEGKHPISLWQKAELDIRYENQMQILQNLRIEGVEYAWISSHPDCSKRCEKWQGKLVALNQRSKMSGFRVGKLDGNWVYSLPDIMDQKDKYGYHNNIINGFNCRHHLIKYVPNSLPPKEYKKGEISKLRNANDKIKKMERQIRDYKTKQVMYNINDKATARIYENKAKLLTAQYKAFCEKNGFQWEQYRINITR